MAGTAEGARKARLTKLKRYGADYEARFHEKAKKTRLDKYGADHYAQMARKSNKNNRPKGFAVSGLAKEAGAKGLRARYGTK